MSEQNIKITVEVDGKIVPLDTISTETFEKIKAAAKELEYEGVYVGDYLKPADRVFFEVTDEICDYKGQIIVLDEDGDIRSNSPTFERVHNSLAYNNVRKLGT